MSIKKYLNSLSCLFSYVVQMETLNITYIITTNETNSNNKLNLIINYILFFVKGVNNV
jgi:hypothetical protein